GRLYHQTGTTAPLSNREPNRLTHDAITPGSCSLPDRRDGRAAGPGVLRSSGRGPRVACPPNDSRPGTLCSPLAIPGTAQPDAASSPGSLIGAEVSLCKAGHSPHS